MTEHTFGWSALIDSAPSKGRILLVEDEKDTRLAIQRLVTRLGHTVKATASAEEADEWMSSERFDLCLLDVELPRMSGIEFLHWAMKRDPEMAVIMLTGVDAPEVAVECIDAGARTYLVKPVELTFLRVAIRDALAMRALLVERNKLLAGDS